jgi:hypothetical protein
VEEEKWSPAGRGTGEARAWRCCCGLTSSESKGFVAAFFLDAKKDGLLAALMAEFSLAPREGNRRGRGGKSEAAAGSSIRHARN